MIDKSKKGAFESNAKMVLKAIEYKKIKDEDFDPTQVNLSNLKGVLGLDDENYDDLVVKVMNGKEYITIVGKNKWAGLTVGGTQRVTIATETVVNFVGDANKPVLAPGMTPIKYDGSTCVETTEDHIDWYNYNPTHKKWATVKTKDGSMWVWIPRYVYKISNGWHSNTVGTIDIQFSKGINDNWNKNVLFGETAESSNASTNGNKYTNHPAFTFGDVEVTGFWAAKFEASDDGSGNVKIVPNARTITSISVNDSFNKAKSMEKNEMYGWGKSGNG
ncbi:MAG TPA: hypothetical protein GXZ95_04425 [Mollicutes bacterium]|nr:hypothetical protein [Mollicutes bacterium]